MNTTKAWCAPFKPSRATQWLIGASGLAGCLLLGSLYPYASFSQKPLCILMVLAWGWVFRLLWYKAAGFSGSISIQEGEVRAHLIDQEMTGQLKSPYWPGDFACLLSCCDEKGKRHWFWLAHDAMSQAEFAALNVLLRSNRETEETL